MTKRTVLVTGASRGIGASIAERLSSDGWTVMKPTRSELNLTDSSSIQRFLDSAISIDGLVLNAGFNQPQRLNEISDSTWNTVLNTNLEASFQLIRGLVPPMAQRGFGRVVAISSLYATRSRIGRAAYSSSKAGLEALVRSIAIEYSANGLLANVVAPGFINTELTRQNNGPQDIQRLVDRIPVGRLGEPHEVASVVSFLMGSDNSYINGQTLTIDGGWSCT
jgi:NAD(P)-dependent dehydrogenase (short-subunit alcohol dehydrogenase family)